MKQSMLNRLWVVIAVAISADSIPINSEAELLVWDFTAKVSDIYGATNLLPITVSLDDTIQGTFSYQDTLTKYNPLSYTYADAYMPLRPEAYFEVTAPGLTSRTLWNDYVVTVTHQGFRDIASVHNGFSEMLDGGMNYSEDLWISCTDNSLTLFPSLVLPTNWHTLPVSSNTSFSYSLTNGGIDDSVTVTADIQSITLRAIPEPNSVALLLVGGGILYWRKRTRLPTSAWTLRGKPHNFHA